MRGENSKTWQESDSDRSRIFVKRPYIRNKIQNGKEWSKGQKKSAIDDEFARKKSSTALHGG